MTAPLRPANSPDPDEPRVYVQPVDDTGMPLADPRPADYSFDHLTFRERLASLAATELAHRHTAEPIPWEGATLASCAPCARSGLTVVVRFRSLWEAASPAGLRDSPDHRLLPSTGGARETSALALWAYASPPVTDGRAPGMQLPLTAADLWDPDQWAGLHRARRAVTLLGARGADAWLQALGRDPQVWREAAASVLLADDWDVTAADPARGGVRGYFFRRLTREIKSWRDCWQRRLNHRRVALLSETLPDGRTVASIADEASQCPSAEHTALERLEITGDPCVLKIMATLTDRETRIADIYARTSLSWARAAELAGHSAQAGDTVYRKLRRLGAEHARRARAGSRHPSGPSGCPHSRVHPAGGPQPPAHTPVP